MSLDFNKKEMKVSSGHKNILFRADSSSTIGTGHIMRDLVLAKQYPDANITFATMELSGNINHRISEAGYDIELLQTSTFNELDQLIKKLNIDMMVIDHYDIDFEFEKKLQESNPNLTIFVLDDTYEKHYCDILLNHNIYADKTRYTNLLPEDCEVRCGSKYTLLRDEFIEEKKSINTQKEAIFVGMGGADNANLSQKILQALLGLTDKKINIVTTSANQNLALLQELTAHLNNVELHIDSKQIATLMNQSKLAIASPSVILNELFYLNIPFLVIKTASNQNEMIEFLQQNNFAVMEEWNTTQFLQLAEPML